jgi:repressor LexA
MTIYERIKYLREERGMSQQELAEKVGYKTASAVNKIELGLRDINQSKIVEFAKALNTTPSYLLGDDQFNIFSIPNIIPIPKMKEIPLLGTIACGEPITAVENIETYITVDAKANVDFALRCKGDSMINARIFDGDIVYIHSQPDVENGEIAAVLIDNEATLKKVYKYPNKLVLSPCNPMYDDLVYSEEQLENVRILGKAVFFVSVVK